MAEFHTRTRKDVRATLLLSHSCDHIRLKAPIPQLGEPYPKWDSISVNKRPVILSDPPFNARGFPLDRHVLCSITMYRKYNQ